MEKFASKVYGSQEGRHALHGLYRKYLAAVGVPLTERMAPTRFGLTHVVLYGNPAGRPVLMFGGMNALNPVIAAPFLRGLDMNRILLIVPDPTGSVGFSAEETAPVSGRETGEWVCQLMDALELSCVAVLGYSFGATTALQFCVSSVLRVERLLLVMPSGILRTPSSKLSKLRRLAGKNEQSLTDRLVARALVPLMPFPNDTLSGMTRMLLLHSRIKKEGRKPVRKSKLRKLNAPVCVVAEKSDVLFPGQKVAGRAKKIFPQLAEVRLLTTGAHYGLFREDTSEGVEECFAAMSAFLDGEL
ncbi:MAG: alpha/beta hydrolase [Tannerella sp.]|jgi:pimeloyl-ACP methyl ester carboxylesterase|nr:alpha/beta hydrolase [Tannerella sp.]